MDMSEEGIKDWLELMEVGPVISAWLLAHYPLLLKDIEGMTHQEMLAYSGMLPQEE